MSKRKSILRSRRSPTHRKQVVRQAEKQETTTVNIHIRHRPSNPGFHALKAEQTRRHRALSHDEFHAQYGADPAELEQIEAFAQEHNLRVLSSSIPQRTVVVEGTIEAMEKAFEINLKHFEHDSEEFRSYEGELTLPEDIADIVEGIVGLDNKTYFSPHVVQKNGNEDTDKKYFLATEVAKLYAFPDDVTGKNQKIAILELGGGYDEAVLKSYFEKVYQRPMPNIQCVMIGDAKNDYQNSSARDINEVYLDIEMAAALAPDAKFTIYFADKSVKGLIDMFKQAIHAEGSQGSIISFSWGANEIRLGESDVDVLNNTLRDALTLGITICASTGDTGSSLGADDGNAYVEFPASSPYVLACTGSSLSVQDGQITEEVVWNNSFGCTGGGVSTIIPVPEYQTEHDITPKHVNTGKPGRGTADACGHADPGYGYLVYVPYTSYIAGTSAVAPMWAALIALLNEKLDTHLGFINPLLYQIAHTTEAFHDITQGQNATKNSKGYAATEGWDACTGLGSPNGMLLYQALLEILSS